MYTQDELATTKRENERQAVMGSLDEGPDDDVDGVGEEAGLSNESKVFECK